MRAMSTLRLPTLLGVGISVPACSLHILKGTVPFLKCDG